jgi:hypothetical protein
MPSLTAVLVDCACDPSVRAAPEGPLRELAGWYDALDVAAHVIRLSMDAISGADTASDEWYAVLAQLANAHIVVLGLADSTGPRSSVPDILIQALTDAGGAGERLPLFNKVGAVVAAANDGGAPVAEVLAGLAVLGCTAAPGTDLRSLASSTVHLARILRDNPLPGVPAREAPDEVNPLPRKIFGGVPTAAAAADATAVESERREAAEGRLVERRRMLDLTRPEKGLPEKRKLPRPQFPPPSGDGPGA